MALPKVSVYVPDGRGTMTLVHGCSLDPAPAKEWIAKWNAEQRATIGVRTEAEMLAQRRAFETEIKAVTRDANEADDQRDAAQASERQLREALEQWRAGRYGSRDHILYAVLSDLDDAALSPESEPPNPEKRG